MQKIILSVFVILLASCGTQKIDKDQEPLALTFSQIESYIANGFTYMEIVTIKNTQPCDFLLTDKKGNLYEVKIGLEELRQVPTTHILVKYNKLPKTEAGCTNTIAIDIEEIKLLQ